MKRLKSLFMEDSCFNNTFIALEKRPLGQKKQELFPPDVASYKIYVFGSLNKTLIFMKWSVLYSQQMFTVWTHLPSQHPTLFQPNLRLGVQFVLFLFTVNNNCHWVKKKNEHRWHLCEIGSKNLLELCRLTRVCVFMAGILNQENTQHWGFLLTAAAESLTCMWMLEEKNPSNNCIAFTMYFLITKDKHIFKMKCCQTHCSFKSLLN